MSFDAVVDASGGFGRYQWAILLFYQMGVWTLCSNWLFMVLAGYNPPSCSYVDFDSANLTDAGDLITNSSMVHSSESVSNVLAGSCKSYFNSIVSEWHLNTPSMRHIPSHILTAQMVGIFFGPLVGGQISDSFGRKKTLLVGFLLMTIFGIISGFVQSWLMFAVFRVIIGFFTGFFTIQYVFFVEIVPPKHRQITFYGGWPLGYVWFGLLGFLTRDWRYLSFAVNIFSVIPIIILMFYTVESPKWLLEKHRVKEARVAMEYIAKTNGKRTSWKQFEIEWERLAELVEQESVVVKKTYSYHDLFGTKDRVIHTIALAFVSFVVSALSYNIIFGIGKLSGDPTINTMLMGTMRLPVSCLAALFDRRFKWFGRQLILQIGTIGMGAGIATMGVLQFLYGETAMKSTAYLVCAMLTMSFCTLVWMARDFWQQELYPTALRTMGNAVSSGFARVGNIVAPQISLLEVFWLPLGNLVMVCMAVTNCVVGLLLLPESKNRPLPDLTYNSASSPSLLQHAKPTEAQLVTEVLQRQTSISSPALLKNDEELNTHGENV